MASGSESLCFLGKRGRRNGAEPYQKAILTDSGYRGGGIPCTCCGHIWADKDTNPEEAPCDKETDNDKVAFKDAEERV